MDLRQLRTFVHVAELGNISAAAQRLNLAQSALTRQLQLLEGDLGISLLQRHGRGVSTTPRGEVFLRRARGILREVCEAREEVRGEDIETHGVVGIGLPPDLAASLALKLFDLVAEQMPGISLKILSGYGDDVTGWMHQGIIDFGILCTAVPAPTRKLHTIGTEPLFIIATHECAPDLPAACAVDDLRSLPLILPSRRHFITGLIEAAFAKAGVIAHIAAEVDELHILMAMVTQGRGVTIGPLRTIQYAAEADRPLLRVIPFSGAGLARSLALAEPLDRLPARAALKLRDLTLAMARNAVAKGALSATPPVLVALGPSTIEVRGRGRIPLPVGYVSSHTLADRGHALPRGEQRQ